jgi:exodeoxyribonuclease V alpha subunit
MMPGSTPRRTDGPTSAPETLSGLLERVTYHNPENGFCVLRVQVRGRRELATVIGNLPAANAGEWVHAEGAWVRDKERGLQFKASALKATPPTSREGIEKYLGSGLIKGIGPVYAKRLVEKFGEKVLEIIDHESARLEEIDGIGSGRRQRIKEAWKAQRTIRDIMLFLHSHGVGTARAVRIYKTYGEKAIETVRNDPYTLARDIHGIGFKSADALARRLGIPLESPLRARAGIEHVLLEATGEGHCALPEPLLLERACALLGLDEGHVRPVLDGLVDAGSLRLDPLTDFLFLPNLLAAEEALAERFRFMAGVPGRLPAVALDKALLWCRDRTGKELAPSQRDAVAAALQHRAVVITGGPGVGKTTILDTFLRILKAKGVCCLLASPTGRAAKRLSEATGMEAKTIHRLLEFQPSGFARNRQRPLECDLLVVDEASMLDLPLAHRLLDALPAASHLVLVGDADQLPSVGPGLVLRDLIASRVVPTVRLTEIFRQAAQSRIITGAHAVNAGRMPDFAARDGPGEDLFLIDREEPERIADTLLDVVADRIPQKLGIDPIRDVQVLCPMNRGSLGAIELNRRLQERLNPRRQGEPTVERFGWEFRPRDKVIQTENDYDKEVFNGDLGQITSIDPGEGEVVVRFDARSVTYEFDELDEIALAYAITIHKSQGSEFPAVVLPLATQHFLMLQRNLVYTGITRGRRMVVLVGQTKALGMAVRSEKASERFTGLRQRLADSPRTG